ncbi:T9SS type A sorting domain-containing protein [Flavobacterium sp.]|uniref:T9SS type A sorting domain-containing protein n=1 Tax=Flavobacterium sp. TaxID=239 RepID=UPI003F6987DB
MTDTGLCGTGLRGKSFPSNFVWFNTGWQTDLSGSWTISFYIHQESTVSKTSEFHIFGDAFANNFRCFTNGDAGYGNYLIRTPGGDNICYGAALPGKHFVSFVYDSATLILKSYLNGKTSSITQLSTALKIKSTSTSNSFKIGGHGASPGMQKNAVLDNFMLFSKALDSAQLEETMTGYFYPELNVSICGNEYLSPSGKYMYMKSGTFYDTVASASGCDSIFTINLTLIKPPFKTVSVSDCEKFQSPNRSYPWTTTGTYYDTLIAASGCDSIVEYKLTILTNRFFDSVTVCKNWMSPSGKMYTQSGTYRDTLINTAGCDSIIESRVTIDTMNTGLMMSNNVISANQFGANYAWLDCTKNYEVISGEYGQSFTPTVNGSYAVELTLSSCKDTSSCIDVVGLGIKHVVEIGVGLFPNPSTGVFVLRSYQGQIDQVFIRNNMGQIIKISKPDVQSEIEFDLSNEVSGIYMVEVHKNGIVGSFKLIKI